jgi:hypothetical protein
MTVPIRLNGSRPISRKPNSGPGRPAGHPSNGSKDPLIRDMQQKMRDLIEKCCPKSGFR